MKNFKKVEVSDMTFCIDCESYCVEPCFKVMVNGTVKGSICRECNRKRIKKMIYNGQSIEEYNAEIRNYANGS